MYSHTRRAVLAVLLVAALVAVLGVRAGDFIINTGGSTSDQSFDGNTAQIYFFEKTSSAISSVAIEYKDSSVSGSGLTVQGLSAPDSRVPLAVSTTFSSTIVVDSSITVAGILPPQYTLAFTGVQAASQSAGKALFTVSDLVMTNNNTFVIRGVAAAWASGSTGVVVQVSGAAPSISTNSAFFITSTTVTGSAASVFDSSSALEVAGNSIFAVDVVTCAGCTQPIVNQAATLDVNTNSIFRVSEVTAGASTLISTTAVVSVSGGSIFQVSDSSVTGSSFFDFGASFNLEDSDSKAVFKGLTSSSATRVVAGTGSVPTSVCATCNVYGGGSSTTSGGALSTVQKWLDSGVKVNVLVDDDTNTVTDGTANGSNPPSTGSCSDAMCLSANTVAHSTDAGCQCDCKAGYNAPSCSTATDSGSNVATTCTVADCLVCNVDGTCAQCAYGYTLGASGCTSNTPAGCDAAHCVTCKSGTTDQCVQCEEGYLPNAGGVCTAIPECIAPNCAECETLDGNTCKVCNTGSTMNAAGECKLCSDLMEGCVECSSPTICTKCAETYTLTNNQCKKKYSGATAGSPVTLALAALVASVLAAYVL